MFTKGRLASPHYGAVPCLALAILFGLASAVGAQTYTTVQFTASLDHNVVFNGVPVLTRYDLRIYLQGATAPIANYDLGKPTPDANNQIIAVNPSWFVGLAMNVLHVARVAAIGPAGEGVSDPSLPFGSAAIPRAPVGPPVVR